MEQDPRHEAPGTSGSPGKVERRSLLRAGGIGLAGLGTLSGCGLLSTEPAGEEEPNGKKDAASHPKEAPDLARQVKAGKLPPLKKRLPDEPLVLDTVERAGTYGGDWQSVMRGASDTIYIYRTIQYDQLMTWDRDFTEPGPNIVKSLKSLNQGREYVAELRPGMKWSDGHPFTADDLIFAYDDMLLNTDVYPATMTTLVVNGKPVRVKKVDDHTVRFLFAAPNGLFKLQQAGPVGRLLIPRPRHYLKQFHADYNAQVKKLTKQQGYDKWSEMLLAKADAVANPDLPTLNAWRITVPVGKGNRVIAERNPYYWKTDSNGSQLPYLDRVVYDVINTDQVILLKASGGDLSYELQHINRPRNKPVLARNRSQGDYRFIDARSGQMNKMIIALNLCHQEPELREVFQSKDFRIGLSYAINRQEVITTIFQEQGKPWQAAPRKDSPYYLEELARQYTAYDVAKANEHLDRSGFTERDSGGFRLRSDGKRISFAIETLSDGRDYWADALEMIAGYWKKVGVDMRTKSEDRSLFYERKEANSHDANIWDDAGGVSFGAMLDPRWFFPSGGESNYAIPWATWYTSEGKSGERPPAPARKQMELYEKLKATADPKARDDLLLQILRIAQEQFWVIGIVLPTGGFGIARNDFRNVPAKITYSWTYVNPGPLRPEQFFVTDV